VLQTAGRADVCIRIQWYVLRVPFSFLFFVVFGVWALGSCAERERSKSAIHMTVCSLKRDRAHLLDMHAVMPPWACAASFVSARLLLLAHVYYKLVFFFQFFSPAYLRYCSAGALPLYCLSTPTYSHTVPVIL
jgi:hypothetical protein